MTVECTACGQEWPYDPSLLVECPNCHAPVGVRCRRPSGHGGGPFTDTHAAREPAAMAAGLLQRCPAAPPELQESLL